MKLLKAFQEHLDKNLPFLKEKRLLVAVSGGLDSVVLSHLCHQAKCNISLAHCNFNLRGSESDADEEFVLQLAEDLDLEVFVESFDTQEYAQRHKLSIQMAARELRYQWFQELAQQLQFDYILTAHHTDDNLETFLINLSRGTGLEGLTGIPQVNGKLARPLLPFSRDQIEAFAKESKVSWREDSSNSSAKYLRNKLRHEIIPRLKEVNPTLLQNFNKTQEHLQESSQIIADAIERVCEQVTDKTEGNTTYFNIDKLRSLPHPKAYVYQLFKDYGFTEWDDVLHLLDAQSGKFIQSLSHRLLKDREQLILSEISDRQEEYILIDDTEEKVKTPLGVLGLETLSSMEHSGSNSIYVDKDLLKFPLTVRHWKNGDYFYPFGMKGKKKLSKFFKDEKFSLLEKEQALVLCTNYDDAIIWILNKRLDDRFKVTKTTKTILKITISQ